MTIKDLEIKKEGYKAKQSKWKDRGLIAFGVAVLSWYVTPEVLPIAAVCFGWSVMAAGWYELAIWGATKLQREEAENLEIK